MVAKPADIHASGCRHRPALTMVECTVAVAIVAVLMVIVAQCLAMGLQARLRTSAHQAALELADNLMEEARAQPWDNLDKSWADAHKVPAAMESLLPGGKIEITVQAEPKQPLTRRVLVTVHWQFEAPSPQSVTLTALFSSRTAPKSGGQP